MKAIIIVDIYGDGKIVRAFEDKPGFGSTLAGFRRRERKGGENRDYMLIEDYMAKFGHPVIPHRKVTL